MWRFMRVAGLAGVTAGSLIIASVSANAGALDALAARLTNDPNACWQFEKFLSTGTWERSYLVEHGSYFQDKAGSDTGISFDGDIGTPGETYINIVSNQSHSYTSRWRRVPCPPPDSYTGLDVGLQMAKLFGFLSWVESPTGTQNSAKGDPLGGGVNIGYGFNVNNIVIDPFLSLDYPNSKVNYVFPGGSGSFIGAKNNYEGTAGVKIGPTFQSVWLYAILGVSVLNEKLTVNFVPVSSSTTTNVPGTTLGLGGAIQPAWLQVFGMPTSLSLEWQHTWWQTATFNNPASSPGFGYAFQRQDDQFLLSLNFYLSH